MCAGGGLARVRPRRRGWQGLARATRAAGLCVSSVACFEMARRVNALDPSFDPPEDSYSTTLHIPGVYREVEPASARLGS